MLAKTKQFGSKSLVRKEATFLTLIIPSANISSANTPAIASKIVTREIRQVNTVGKMPFLTTGVFYPGC